MSEDAFWCQVYLAALPPLLTTDSFLRVNDKKALRTVSDAAAALATDAGKLRLGALELRAKGERV